MKSRPLTEPKEVAEEDLTKLNRVLEPYIKTNLEKTLQTWRRGEKKQRRVWKCDESHRKIVDDDWGDNNWYWYQMYIFIPQQILFAQTWIEAQLQTMITKDEITGHAFQLQPMITKDERTGHAFQLQIVIYIKTTCLRLFLSENSSVMNIWTVLDLDKKRENKNKKSANSITSSLFMDLGIEKIWPI